MPPRHSNIDPSRENLQVRAGRPFPHSDIAEFLPASHLPRMLQLTSPMSAPESRFVKACHAQPVDRTPVWFMRQAGRYMPEYRAVRKQYSLIEICKRPDVAAEVTITAAEALGVDAAIIFADLLLPLEVMGLPFYFSPGEGPVIEQPDSRSGRHRASAHRPRRRTWLCFRGGAVWFANTSDRAFPSSASAEHLSPWPAT